MKNDLTQIVEGALRNVKETRDSDNKLIYVVMRKYGAPQGATFESIINGIIEGRFPAFASITRAKRKVVEMYPELDACAKVKAFREQQEQMYKEYARQ